MPRYVDEGHIDALRNGYESDQVAMSNPIERSALAPVFERSRRGVQSPVTLKGVKIIQRFIQDWERGRSNLD